MEGLWVGIVEPYFHHNFLGQLYMFFACFSDVLD